MERLGRAEWISKLEFHSRLQRWYRRTDEPVIGDPEADRRTAWLWVRDGHRLARLFADTARDAVGEYLELLNEHGGELEWSVVPSATGQLTKIALGPGRVVIDGFHLYVDPRTLPRKR